MKFQVVFHPRAELDIEDARQWLAKINPEVAERWYDKFLDATISLETFPTRCPIKFHDAGPHRHVRRLLFGSGSSGYLIYFKIGVDLVTILRVRHGARRPLEADEFD